MFLVGTIFSSTDVLHGAWNTCSTERFLQKGVKQVAAGYVVYGSSTMIVYTTGNGAKWI